MWFIHYGLHFTINHSLFKRQSQICSKLHQISWKIQWLYVQDKMFINWTPIQETWCLFKKKRIRISSNAQFLTTNYYPHQKINWSQRFYFLNQTWGHVQLQSPVFYVQWVDAWWLHYEFIIGYHRTKTNSAEKDLFSKIKDDKTYL